MGQILAIDDIIDYCANYICNEENLICQRTCRQLYIRGHQLIKLHGKPANMTTYAARYNPLLFKWFPPIDMIAAYSTAIEYNFESLQYLTKLSQADKSKMLCQYGQSRIFLAYRLSCDKISIINYLIENNIITMTRCMKCITAADQHIFEGYNPNFKADIDRGAMYYILINHTNIKGLDYLRNEGYFYPKQICKYAVRNDNVKLYNWLIDIDIQYIFKLCGAILQRCYTESVKWLVKQNDYVNARKEKQNTLYNAIVGIIKHNKMAYDWTIQHYVDLRAMCHILHKSKYTQWLDDIGYLK